MADRDALEEVLRSNEDLRLLNERLLRENQQLSEKVALLLNRLYGKSTEKIDPDQLRLFLDAAGENQSEVAAESESEKKSSRKPKPGHGRRAFPAQLDRIEVTCDLPESERSCSCCQSALVAIGEDICERGHVIPARIVVRRYIKKKYACPNGHEVRTGEAPAGLIDRCKYEPSVYAHCVVFKYADHMPLHRQEAIWKRQGFHLPKSTMWEMIQRVDELAAAPILDQMRREVLSEDLIHADETPITIIEEDRKGSRTGYIWVYATGNRMVFDYTTGRGRDGPIRFLGDFAGKTVTDGYAGYDEPVRNNGITRAGCWSHVRRRFKDALTSDGPRSARIMRLIAWLYRLESLVSRWSASASLSIEAELELRCRLRERLSRKILAKIETKLVDYQRSHEVLPKSALGSAVGYALGQWSRLVEFVNDPVIPLDNNLAERALRPIALGRKNWLFAGSERARCAANLYSLIGSCKALGVDPAAYLEDVLNLIGTTPAKAVASLTPWACAEARAVTPLA